MLVNLTVFSQTVTETITTDSIVPLPQNVAREVVKDLIRKDSIKAELDVCYSNQIIFKDNLRLKDSIIDSKDNEIKILKISQSNYETVIRLKDAQLTNLDNLVIDLNRKIKGYKIKNTLKKVGNYAAYASLIFVIVKLIK